MMRGNGDVMGMYIKFFNGVETSHLGHDVKFKTTVPTTKKKKGSRRDGHEVVGRVRSFKGSKGNPGGPLCSEKKRIEK